MRSAALLMLVGLMLPGAPAASARPNAAQACAALDLHLVTLLEEHGEAAEIDGEGLMAVVAALIEARRACRESRFDEALDLYARLALGPVRSRPLR